MSNQSCMRTRVAAAEPARPSHARTISIVFAGTLFLAGCGGAVIRQGHLFQDEDVNQIKAGMGKDQVVLALGSPDHQSAAGGGAYYYISTTASQPMAFMKPEVTDRRVVAGYFYNKKRGEQGAQFGVKDGEMFDFLKRETPFYSRDQGVLKELFRDIGAAPSLPGTGGGRGGPGQ